MIPRVLIYCAFMGLTCRRGEEEKGIMYIKRMIVQKRTSPQKTPYAIWYPKTTQLILWSTVSNAAASTTFISVVSVEDVGARLKKRQLVRCGTCFGAFRRLWTSVKTTFVWVRLQPIVTCCKCSYLLNCWTRCIRICSATICSIMLEIVNLQIGLAQWFMQIQITLLRLRRLRLSRL